MNWIALAKKLAESLFQKMAWEAQYKPLLKSHNISIGLGADGTKSKLFKQFEENETFARYFHEKFYPYYIELVYSGDCTIKIYDLDNDTFNGLYRDLSSVNPNSSLSKKNFPYLIPDDELHLLSTTTHLTYKAEYHGRMYLFFSTNRAIKESTKINPNSLEYGIEVKEFLKKFSMITAISENPRQYIDVVCLNPANLSVEVRLDTSSVVAAKDIKKLFDEVEEAFSSLLPLRITNAFRNPTNFFPLIESLYKNQACKVCELSFVSEGGFVHSERDRSKSGDVRKGDFHIGGVGKCKIKPYKISTRWGSSFTKTIPYELELSLNSSYRELGKLGCATLEYATISSCPKISDLDEILNILKPKDELSKVG